MRGELNRAQAEAIERRQHVGIALMIETGFAAEIDFGRTACWIT
jgi:hypothetical protein